MRNHEGLLSHPEYSCCQDKCLRVLTRAAKFKFMLVLAFERCFLSPIPVLFLEFVVSLSVL
jgi:hypothetical protein